MSGISEESFTLHCEMALNADTGKNSTKYLTGELGFEHELSSECLPQEADHCIISVQVLEFKTRLLEAVEELHIHRDAELKLEEQISKLVLEKQELEWQKESLQHQMNSLVNQHTESLTAVKNQCDSRIRGIEGEKGKHQLTAELKHKEINSLKEELKLLQLSKYTLQKKLSELEQKLHLQMQTKDNHLNQLSEVEKRFGAVSRKCAAVKQAHGKLEQNVEEALRLNKRLSGVNKKQEDTINCLKKDIEKLNCELVQSKVSSACKSGEKSFSHTVKEQQMQQLQQKLHVETEINKNLVKETAAMRAENQEVMNSLRQAQRLLQMQTEAVGRVELELSAQREEYQALKREHELLKEKTREKDRFVSLAEEYKKSKTKWEKESNLKDHDKDNRKPMSENTYFSWDISCITKDNAIENEIFQDDSEFVKFPVIPDQGPSDLINKRDNEYAPDEGSVAGNRLPETDCRVVVKEQAVHVCTQGAGEGAFPAGPADVLGACEAAEKQQADPGERKTSAGESDPVHSTLPEGLAYPRCRGDSVSQPPGPKSWPARAADGGEEVKREEQQDQTERMPDRTDRTQAADNHSEGNRRSTESEGTVGEEAAALKDNLNSGHAGPHESLSSDPLSQTKMENYIGSACLMPQGSKVSSPDSGIKVIHLASAAQGDHKTHNEPSIRTGTEKFQLSLLQPLNSNLTGPENATDTEPETNAYKNQHLGLEKDHAPDVEEALIQNFSETAVIPDTHRAMNTEAPSITDCPGTDTGGACALELNMSHRSAVPTSSTSPPECVDREDCIQDGGGHKVKGQHSLACDAQNTQNKESSSLTHSNMAENLKTDDIPLKCNSVNLNERIRNDKNLTSSETDSLFSAGNKTFRSFLDLGLSSKETKDLRMRNSFVPPLKGIRVNSVTSRPSAPQIPSVFTGKTGLPCGYHDIPSPCTISKLLIQKDEPNRTDSPVIKRAADMLNPSRIHPRHKRDLQGEWNAIAQTFCEISAEHGRLSRHAPQMEFKQDGLPVADSYPTTLITTLCISAPVLTTILEPDAPNCKSSVPGWRMYEEDTRGHIPYSSNKSSFPTSSVETSLLVDDGASKIFHLCCTSEGDVTGESEQKEAFRQTDTEAQRSTPEGLKPSKLRKVKMQPEN